MTRRNTILIGISFLFLGYFVLSSRSAGIANANGMDTTGSPISSGLCTNCHADNNNFNTTAVLQILDGATPVTSYVPGTTYMMTLQVSGTAPKYGGQAVALTSSNTNAGVMGTPTTTQTRVTDLSGISYLEQSTRSDSGTFTVPWTAPAMGTGNVNIYYVGNGVNGSGTAGDDPTGGMTLVLTEAPGATCFDGIQNQDETGIDCGGVCPACIPTLFVDASATSGANDGSSWADAFTDLQDALAIGAGNNIHIAEGTYYPTSGTSRGAAFNIPDAATLLGGYPSGGGARDIENNTTILSGNIDGVSTYAGNSFHVVKLTNVDDVVIDGLTIRDGNADNASSFGRARGGGLYVVGSTLELNNTEVIWNKAIYGGGIFATLTPTVEIVNSVFKKNESEFGSAIYHSNTTNMYIRSSRITENNSTFRCAIEINNSSYTMIENSVVADNASTNANAIAFIATNRTQTCDIYNTTIVGETKNKALISLQIGNNDLLGVNIYNSIIAHQNLNFDKAFVVFNNNVLNLNVENCYVQGSALPAVATGTANLFSDTAGDLLLNADDFSISECSPAADAGNDANTNGLTVDIDGNDRFFSTVDMGAYEAQADCPAFQREVAGLGEANDVDFSIYPNPTSGTLFVKTELENTEVFLYDAQGKLSVSTRERELDISNLPPGIYLVNLTQNGKIMASEKIMKL